MTQVGALLCQRDSYRRECEAKVESCDYDEQTRMFAVRLSDTVLFPEGGGQPSDRGSLGHAAVEDVKRVGLDCVHFTRDSVDVGSTVRVQVDWARRFDHMQQHTGQHLLSAVGDALGFVTVSWALGDTKCSIEVTGTPPTAQDMQRWQDQVNAYIREARPVRVLGQQDLDSLPPLLRAKTAVHDAATGTLRWISIDGVDVNPCCGTHLQNIAELQLIVFLPGMEKIRGGSNTRLFWLCGQRAEQALADSVAIQKSLTAVLNVPPNQFEESVKTLQAECKSARKQVEQLWKELTPHVAGEIVRKLQERLLAMTTSTGSLATVFLHREDVSSMMVLQSIANEVTRALQDELRPWLLLLCSGAVKQGGAMLIAGRAEAMQSEQITELLQLLEVKGSLNAKLGRWQGKTMQNQWKVGALKQLQKEFGL